MKASRGPKTPTLTALPAVTAADDGLEIRYLADATAGVEWVFRYRHFQADGVTVNPSVYKWECIGGSALSNYDGGQRTAAFSQSTWGSLSPMLQVIAPLSGVYLADLSESLAASTLGNTFLGMYVAGAVPSSGAVQAAGYIPAAAAYMPYRLQLAVSLLVGQAAGDGQWQDRAAATSLTRLSGMLTLRPVRVG